MSRKKALLPTPLKEVLISWHLERKSLREIAQLTGRSYSNSPVNNKEMEKYWVFRKSVCKGRPSTFSTRDANRLKRIV